MVMPEFRGGTLTALKWLAVVLMVVDHVDWLVYGRTLGLHDTLGRLVFPIFGAIVGYNAARPGALLAGAHGRMVRRMLLVGVLATPVYVYLAGWIPLNIMFTLALGVWVCNVLQHDTKGSGFVAVALVLVGGALVDYQWFGLAYIVAVWAAYSRRWSPWWVLAAAVALVVINGNLVALWALPVLFLVSRLRLQLPRHQLAFYAVYPVHLVGLALAAGW